MSDLYIQDGFKPLKLPRSGIELQAGRQYYLSPIARTILDEVYGLRGLPTIVECLLAERPTTHTCTTTWSADRSVKLGERWVEQAAQKATFRAFLKLRVIHKFVLDLDKIAELEPFYAQADKVSEYEKGDSRATKRKNAKLPDLSILEL